MKNIPFWAFSRLMVEDIFKLTETLFKLTETIFKLVETIFKLAKIGPRRCLR